MTNWPRAALLSLSDKAGVVEFARVLAAHGTRLVGSGGTAKHLRDAGLEVTAVEDVTGFPEMLGGRVKTLHPHVHGAILARRGLDEDMVALEERGIEAIDLVAVTLYPFEARATSLDDAAAIEEIDIGGVALLRAAAKNHEHVVVVHSPAQYAEVLAAFEGAGPSPEQRRAWAIAAFARTARYDAAIANELARRGGEETPSNYLLSLERVRGLRYGENPHQQAALYVRAGAMAGLDAAREGKELSYNNLVDVHAAVTLVGRFESPACVIVKHNEPCGVACAPTVGEAYAAALRSDEQSAFGGIVAFNRPLDRATAEATAGHFMEVVVAPDFGTGAELELQKKKNLRVVRLAAQALEPVDAWSARALGPWVLLQRESGAEPVAQSSKSNLDGPGSAGGWRVATKRSPGVDERASLEFAWRVCAAARSNAIVIARGRQLIGLGSGQTSRVDAVDVALMKARRAKHELQGAVLASDGFFPFADNIHHAAEAGIVAVVQPGGSMRDDEVVAACDTHGIAMLFTGRREFRH
ncbi:MAG: bifunctional phosphoribosylaminoimidazolecarboxamide formyltransferase/IMP cyclohydrolase [Candidatus Eisenbacteria bacterium]|uniref:Bifunctional purine biosynthesis protein PurH n=1 Tax=Eiseniibacteriota bacterium TaxID=2212470 RepID=A0A849SQH0_UNCEI|nr:bifunctional phosphoribosylaminoimidazolecarboxamide formyltransferase/IMP cyclohydrolase [Candidatus Eisenbacteria bacterium]